MSLFGVSEEVVILNSFFVFVFGGGGCMGLTMVKQVVCFHANLCDIVFGVLVPQVFVNSDTRSSPLPLSLTAIPLCFK